MYFSTRKKWILLNKGKRILATGWPPKRSQNNDEETENMIKELLLQAFKKQIIPGQSMVRT